MKGIRNFRLEVMIQTVFITVILILSGILISLLVFASVKSSTYLSKKLMVNTALLIFHELRAELRPAQLITNFTASLQEHEIIDSHNMVNYTYLVAKQLPKHVTKNSQRITGWRDEDMNSVETSLEPDGSYSTTIFKPKKSAVSEQKLYRDLNGNIIKQEMVPRVPEDKVSSWFMAAESKGHFTWTDFFLSYPYLQPSIAAVSPIYNGQHQLLGVFEVEVQLKDLSYFLAHLDIVKNGLAYIIDEKSNLIAYAGMEKNIAPNRKGHEKNLYDPKHPWLYTSLQLYRKNQQSYFRYKYGDQYFYAYFHDVRELTDKSIKIAVVIPENDFLGKIKRFNLICLIACMFLLLLGIIFVRVFSKHISNPVTLLVQDTERIKKFDLDFETNIVSRITEIRVLRDAIEGMKKGLKSFKKYLPSDLVRQLIDSGQDVHLGGTEKNITALFSDIRNFTAISEGLDSQQLMTHLCEYFDELSNIILSEQGTIDKYIGDSIMAFWGAPLEDEDHCYHACVAALRCQERLRELNIQWKQQNKPILKTGIGINTGKAIVGNLGSYTRMNYTAIGDSINVASRLEAFTKEYDVSIIVSEDVVHQVKHAFVFELIDKVEVRGKTGLHNIYALIKKIG